MEEMKQFPLRLAQTRLKHHLSRSALAEKIGCHPNLIYLYESGKTLPSCRNAYLLCEALDVTMDFLLGKTKS